MLKEANLSTTDSITPCEDNILLQKVYKKIADPKEDIWWLSEELQKKESLLSSFTTRLPLLSSFMVAEQSKKSASNSAALQDTVVWDPSTSQPSSCSTPNHGTPWTKVVVRAWKRIPDQPAVSPLADIAAFSHITIMFSVSYRDGKSFQCFWQHLTLLTLCYFL